MIPLIQIFTIVANEGVHAFYITVLYAQKECIGALKLVGGIILEKCMVNVVFISKTLNFRVVEGLSKNSKHFHKPIPN